MTLRWGVQPIAYGLTWSESLSAAQAVDRLGFDYLWGIDHLYSAGSDWHEPFLEGWTTLAAWAASTKKVELGLLVSSNPMRNPGLLAKMATTVDHVSRGRLILGLGAGNRESELYDHGLEVGDSVGMRLDWLDESLELVRGLLAGESVSKSSDHYRFDAVRHAPAPARAHVPVLVATEGERKGLRIAARHADLWHIWLAPTEAKMYARKRAILDEYCAAVERDPGEILRMMGGRVVIRHDPAEAAAVFDEQRRVHGWSDREASFSWVGTPRQIAEYLQPFIDIGLDGFNACISAPLDLESVDLLATEVRSLVGRGSRLTQQDGR